MEEKEMVLVRRTVAGVALAVACSHGPSTSRVPPRETGGASGSGGSTGGAAGGGGASGSGALSGASGAAGSSVGSGGLAGSAGSPNGGADAVGGGGGEMDGGDAGEAASAGSSGKGGGGRGGTAGKGSGGGAGKGGAAGSGGSSGTSGAGGTGGSVPDIDCTVFVSHQGEMGAPGTKAEPVSTIAEGLGIAEAGPLPATVCVCSSSVISNPFDANVTLSDGVSLVGSYSCADWTRDSTLHRTELVGTVGFAAGAGHATALGAFYLQAQVSIVDAEPIVFDVWADSLWIQGQSSGLRLSPTILGGRFSQQTGGAAVGVANAAPELDGVYGTTYAGNNTSASQTLAALSVSGNVDGMVVRGGSFDASPGSYAISTYSYGIRVEDCTGSVRFEGVNASGASTAAYGGPWTGLYVRGTSCDARIVGTPDSLIRGCSNGPDCNGVDCDESCSIEDAHLVGASLAAYGVGGTGLICLGCRTVTNSELVGCISTNDNNTGGCLGVELDNYGDPDPLPLFTGNSITGLTTNGFRASLRAEGVRAGPARFEGNLIRAADGPVTQNGNAIYQSSGIHVRPPVFDGNEIYAGTCDTLNSITVIELYRANPTFTNNLIADHAPGTDCSAYGQVGLASISNDAADASGPTFVNNTFLFNRLDSSYRTGLYLSSTKLTFVNNIVANLESVAQGNGSTIYETSAAADPLLFEHNLIYDVGTTAQAGSFVYFDEGVTVTPITTVAGLNALYGGNAAGNVTGNPKVGANGRLLAGSPCIDAGRMALAPGTDIDGDLRPLGVGIDIGADERQ